MHTVAVNARWKFRQEKFDLGLLAACWASSSWGQAGGSGGSWAACWASWSWPRISTTPPHLPKDCSSSWDDLQHRLPQSLHCQRRHSTLSRPSPPCSATMFRNHLPQSCGNSAVGTCRGPVQLWVWPRQKLSQGDSYLQSTLWRMINLLLNMQTDHLAITGKSTPLKNTALENARFPPRAIHWYWIIHHFKVPTYLHAHETVYRINPYHNIPQQSHECMFYTNTQTCTNTWHCVS